MKNKMNEDLAPDLKGKDIEALDEHYKKSFIHSSKDGQPIE